MRDTAHLSLAGHGAYAVLLDTYYATERPLPADYETLYRLCRAILPEEQLVVRKVADQFFPVGEDGLRHNRRADEEIAAARPRIDAARDNGRRGGRPVTWRKPSGLADVGTQPDTHPEPGGKAHHNHNHNHTQEPEEHRSRATPDAARQILDFLNEKTGRGYKPVPANIKLIRARLGEASADDIRSVIAKKAREWKGTEMDQYLRPATLFGALKFAQYHGELMQEKAT